MSCPNACPPRIADLTALAVSVGASDIHFSTGEVPYLRISGEVLAADQLEQSSAVQTVESEEMNGLVDWLIGDQGRPALQNRGSIDGAGTHQSGETTVRFRFNIFRTQAADSIAIRLLDDRFRSLDELGLSDQLYDLCQLKDGLVLVAGPTGSGKSTTLATLIDQINQHRSCHIITIEDPIEYVHQNRRSLISQRQVGIDTPDFSQALVDALRQDPDVILVGELRELQTIRTAIAAAETGHLVFATVHAGDCVGALERLLSVFPGSEQSLIHQMLSTSLRGVIVQHLLRSREQDNDDPMQSRVLASEVLLSNSAVANLIAGGNLNQIHSIIETSSGAGMYTLDSCLARLYRARKIDQQMAATLARNPKMVMELSRAI